MSELSNLLRQRLGVQNIAENNGAVVHPDADTLTAYSEQLLPAPERQQVLNHLIACAECREVLALSQIEAPAAEGQTVLKPAPVSLWRRLLSPTFAVAGVIAGSALIAVLVLQAPHKVGQQQANSEFRVAPSSDQKPAEEAKSAVPAQPESAPQSQPSLALRGQERNSATRSTTLAGVTTLGATPQPNKIVTSKPLAPPPMLTAEVTKQDFVNNAVFETSNEEVVAGGKAYPSAPNPQGQAYETLLKGNAPRGFADIPQNATNGKSTVSILTPTPPQEHFGIRLDKLVTKGAHTVFRSRLGAPAISSNSLATRAMIATPKLSDSTKAESAVTAAAPNIDTDSFFPGGALSYNARARSLSSAETSAANWQVANGKLFKAYRQSTWEEAHTGAAFEFTWVTAHGGEVWAGGTNAGLIHSYDGGNTWNLVKIGEAASGSIVNILFFGNHIQVKTSDDQLWSSTDGGKSWTQN